jgi:hypothetical protein
VVKYQHGEAFCLMTYVSDDGQTGELIWNSRDGVTPFVVTSRDGVEMTHADWHLDVRVPDFRPPPGMRMFVDMNDERALQVARARVEEWWDHPDYPMSARWTTREAAIADLAAEFVGGVTVVEAPPRPPLQKGPFG